MAVSNVVVDFLHVFSIKLIAASYIGETSNHGQYVQR